MTDERQYAAVEVSSILDVTYRQLDYWDRAQIVQPSTNNSSGSGNKRAYTLDDLIRVNLVKKLRQLDFTKEHILSILESYEKKESTTANFAADPSNAVMITIDFDKIKEDTNRKLEEYVKI